MNKNAIDLQALLFDVDGTLADTEEAHRLAFNHTFEQFGLPWHWSTQEYLALLDVTGGRERINHYIESTHAEVPEQVTDLANFIKELHIAKTKRYQDLLLQGQLPLRSGVKRLLIEAREAGLQLAIATTTSRLNVQLLIEMNLGEQAWSWFSVVGAGEDVRQKKPDPEVYQLVLRELGLDPKACIALEDSSNGLLAAKATKLACVITLNDYTRQQDFTQADIVLDQFGEPEQPFSVLQGSATGYSFVNVAMLRDLQQQILHHQ